jgi:YD repeat-containing protein
MWRVLSSSLLAVMIACGDPEWAPPPASAVTSCLYEFEGHRTGVSASTLWFDSEDKLLQIDGRQLVSDDYVKASYKFEYDEQGRLVEFQHPEYTARYTYSADQIVRETDDGRLVLDLVDGRVTHVGGAFGSTRDYTYDSAGRVTSLAWFDAQAGRSYLTELTYDSNNRVATIQRLTRPLVTLKYTETAQQLLIDFAGDENSGLAQRLAFDFDENKHLTRSAVIAWNGTEGSISTFDHSDGEIAEHHDGITVRGTGRCDQPVPVTAPPTSPFPLWTADYLNFRNRAATAFFLAL